MKEKSSESTKTQDLPKVKLALEDSLKEAAKKEAEEEAKRNKPPEESKLPMPTGWRILVLPFQPKRVTKGGIHRKELCQKKQKKKTKKW
jgi:hypothetical protein